MTWRGLAFVHRWLGIAGCLLFILWFVSGIAMMYVRMPEVSPAERYAHLPPLDASRVQVSIADAARTAGAKPAGPVQVTMLRDRPIYRFGGPAGTTVFADTGEKSTAVTPGDARAAAAAFAPGHDASLRNAGLVEIPDQWTLQSRAHLPLHRFTVGDAAGTDLYVSSRTGEVVMDTSRAERFWAYIGPVAHWLYLPVIRRNGPLWNGVIIYSSIAGCILCLTGLIAGIWRLSLSRRFSLRGAGARSPYTGWMKWHHYAGLIFGVITFTWTFSGLLSMGPFPLLSSEGVTMEQRRAVVGTPPPLDALSVEAMRAALATAQAALVVKELSLTTFRSEAYWIAAADPAHRVLVPAAHPGRVLASVDRGELTTAAREAAGSAPVLDLEWLEGYDDHYYDRTRTRALPVLRARYGDAEETWMYLDPTRGSIAMVTRRPDRLNRWLYNGLHSFDFAWLAGRRPLWDVVLIALSVGGLAGAVTSLVPAWRRLRNLATQGRR